VVIRLLVLIKMAPPLIVLITASPANPPKATAVAALPQGRNIATGSRSAPAAAKTPARLSRLVRPDLAGSHPASQVLRARPCIRSHRKPPGMFAQSAGNLFLPALSSALRPEQRQPSGGVVRRGIVAQYQCKEQPQPGAHEPHREAAGSDIPKPLARGPTGAERSRDMTHGQEKGTS